MIVIVGAGHAGAQAAIALRAEGVTAPILMLGAEHAQPYERPPLSKDYLTGERPFARMALRPPAFWAERDVRIETGAEVVAVDAAAHRVTCANGATHDYATLIWAAGGAARRLSCPGHDAAGLHVVRTHADSDAIIAALPDVASVAIVGGGYVGLETAASLVKLGKAVTVVEAAPRLLARVAGRELGAFFAAEHRAHRVQVETGANVVGVAVADGRARGLMLSDGRTIAADLVVAGIGIEPSVGPLIAAGAAAACGGVAVDHYCATSLPDIYAVGDCAAHANRFADGAVVRVESVQNANDQATCAARAVAGRPQPYLATPWFWSNQYDLRLQTVGLSMGAEERVTRGDPAARSFSVIYGRGGRVVALDCVNATRDYVQGRKLVEARTRFDAARLADPDTVLKDLA